MVNNFRFARRNFFKSPAQTAISLLSLILGLTFFFLISFWVKDELSYDTGFADPAQIGRVETNLILTDGTTSSLPTVGWPVGKALAAEYPEIGSLTYMRRWSPVISFNGARFYETAFYADSNFFRVFDYPLLEGSPAAALTEPRSLVISDRLRGKYFGKAINVVGRTLMLNDTIPYKITGVFKTPSTPSHLRFDLLGSFSSTDRLPWQVAQNNWKAFKTTLLGFPAVSSVTAAWAVPGRNGWNGQFAYPEGRTKEQGSIVEYISVDADYLRTLGLSLAAGRDFFPESQDDRNNNLIINESAMRTFGWHSPAQAIGKKLSTSGKDGVVIGVVKDYHQHSLHDAKGQQFRTALRHRRGPLHRDCLPGLAGSRGLQHPNPAKGDWGSQSFGSICLSDHPAVIRRDASVGDRGGADRLSGSVHRNQCMAAPVCI